ncbi:MAG TPA: DUF1566 domain-containing protein [Woeseiaceae bacterium]|nr:DUF1566 domain-containing protein [Woeseiaceae bacterium]
MQSMTKKTALNMTWLGMVLLLNTSAFAGDVVGLRTFTSGTPARASEVNGNFDAVKVAVDDNHIRVSTLEDVDAETRIAALEAQATTSPRCVANTPTRFTDKGDGTVCDNVTGLMWEIKEDCGGIDYGNPRCSNNVYSWSETAPYTEPNGTVFSDFLPKMNDLDSPNDGLATTCLAGHCDWRMPTIGELRSILEAPMPLCTGTPCIAANFPGATYADLYWTSSNKLNAAVWTVNFGSGQVASEPRSSYYHVRAVRNGW